QHSAAIDSPPRLRADVSRDLPFTSRTRKRGDIDLVAPGLVRNISEPAAVGRKLSIDFVELRPQKRERFAISEHGQNPDIVLGVPLYVRAGVSDEAPIERPRGRTLVLF